MSTVSAKFDRDKVFINQRRLSVKGKFYVYDEKGAELFYVERHFRWFGRGNLTIFEDDSKREPVLLITQDHWGIFHRDYTVADIDGHVLANLSRNNFTSLYRVGWDIVELERAIAWKAREDSGFLAALRWIIDLIPFSPARGGTIDADFHFLAPDSAGIERKLGTFIRRFTIFDKYVLDLPADWERKLDRRVALAVGILLDTG